MRDCTGSTGSTWSAEFGILVGEKEYWSRGIGSEATEAIVRHGFDKRNLHRIWLGVFADHDGAIKVYERSASRWKAGSARRSCATAKRKTS